jgi:D-glycero-D-manno-heptose 1,7-bisphosphate phosphatase
MHAVHDRMCPLLMEQAGAHVDATYAATGAGDQAVLERYRDIAQCKPGPAMLLRAAQEQRLTLDGAWMVGDRLTDADAAAGAGVRALHVRTGRGADQEPRIRDRYPQVPVADDLAAAVQIIL